MRNRKGSISQAQLRQLRHRTGHGSAVVVTWVHRIHQLRIFRRCGLVHVNRPWSLRALSCARVVVNLMLTNPDDRSKLTANDHSVVRS